MPEDEEQDVPYTLGAEDVFSSFHQRLRGRMGTGEEKSG